MGRQFSILALVLAAVYSDCALSNAEAGVRGKSFSGIIYSADTVLSPTPLLGRTAFDNGNGFRFDLGAIPVGIVDQFFGLALEQDVGVISFVQFAGFDFFGGKANGAGVQILDLVILGTVTLDVPGKEEAVSGVFAFTREQNPPTLTNK